MVKESARNMLYKRWRITGYVLLFFFIIFLIFIGTNKTMSFELLILFIIAIMLCSGIMRLAFYKYLVDFSKYKEKDWKEDYIADVNSPWAYILLLLIGGGAIYLGIMNMYSNNIANIVLILFGAFGFFGAIYGWLNRKRKMENIRKHQIDKKNFELRKKASLLGIVLLILSDIIYKQYGLSWMQGFILAMGGILIAIIYYNLRRKR